MSKIPLEVPIAIIAAGCVICLLFALGAFSAVIDGAMLIIGFSLCIIGLVLLLAVAYIFKTKKDSSE